MLELSQNRTQDQLLLYTNRFSALYILESGMMALTHERYVTGEIRAGAVLQNSNVVNLVARNGHNDHGNATSRAVAAPGTLESTKLNCAGSS